MRDRDNPEPVEALPQPYLRNILSKDKQLQNEAYAALMSATEVPVAWAYVAWDALLAALSSKDNRARAIAAQVLCNLAQSDPDQRMLHDFEALLNVTRDERFVTARHCLQALWKIGLSGQEQQALVVAGLERRFYDCRPEKNWSLIRFDIIQDLRNLYDATQAESVREKAIALIAAEDDLKYQKKYAGVWK